LFSTIVANGHRHIDEKLLAEFELQRELFDSALPKRRSAAAR
jgi:hypothetical protein